MQHTLGNLYHCQEHYNCYRETPISKHNSYVCNLQGKGGRKNSNESPNQGNTSSISRHQKKCRITDDDLKDVWEGTVALLPLEECAANLASAEAKLAAAEAENVTIKSDSSSFQLLLETPIRERDTNSAKCDALSSDMNQMKGFLGEWQDEVKSLTERVAFWKVFRGRSVAFQLLKWMSSKPCRSPWKRLLPSLNSRERPSHIFDALYEKYKSFKSHVNTRLKAELCEQIRMEVCREIKAFFSHWRLLEIMDCSQQSLNQVSITGTL
jgi:hypothetical protein